MCENLPNSHTFYENKGGCQKPNNLCEYCKKEQERYFCHKKTLTICLNTT